MALVDSRWRRQLLAMARFITWRRTPPWPGFGQPFNGQRLRLKTIRALVEAFDPDGFIETGTFLGHTTRFFAGNGVPVYTAEVKPTIYAMARLRLAFDPDIKLRLGNSRDVIRDIAHKRPFDRPLAYLDAHWWEDLPLPDEVSDILRTWPDAIIVIDDFLVPDDPDYGYDSFQNRPLAIDMLELPPSAMVAFPAQPASQETGGKRGTVYIGQGDAAVEAFRSLVERGLLAATARTSSPSSTLV